MRGLWRSTTLTVLALAVAGPLSPVEAQRRYDGRDRAGQPSAYLGVAFAAADPVGEFGLMVEDGFGVQIDARFPIAADGGLSIRLDGGFLVYGHESQQMCFPAPVGCRIGVELNTTNSVAYVGVGPELAGTGRVAPYINASVGLSYFGTYSSLSGDDDNEDRFNTRNYSDLVTATRLGGGMRVRVGSTSRGPIQLDLGGTYHRNGIAEYLREGDIEDRPDGSIVLYPNRTEANLVTFTVGVSFGLGGGGDGRPEDRRRRRP
jgi:hypothetical protein